MPGFIATDTKHGDTHLKEDRYKSLQGAELADDGIVDEVAIARRLAGDPVRITPRELVCVVAEAAALGMTDSAIASLLGRDDEAGGKAWIRKVRERNGIDSAEPAYDNDDELYRSILEPSHRPRLSASYMRAAGLNDEAIAQALADKKAS